MPLDLFWSFGKMTLEDKLNKNILNVWTALSGGGIALFGENMQYDVKEGLMNYNWAVGHLSDFAASSCISSIVLTLCCNLFSETKGKIISVSLPAIMLSSIELCSKNCDYQDIICYWSGALIAYGINELNNYVENKKRKDGI